MAVNPLLEPGRIVYYPIDFGGIIGVAPHHIVLVDHREVFFRYFIIKTEPSPWQKKNKKALKRFVDIDKSSHPCLRYDSVIYCGELHAERVLKIQQHVREKPKDLKTKISDSVQAEILKRVAVSDVLSPDEKAAVIAYLG